ncbi:hypothetical protein GcM3_024048 [Golovinomyces cichoracearum]|uniref:Uncharacterized protein n=1 Tax=Golovinomyces cichoracearum TaxID=62708 RepID=A0A420J6M6_9PEZI|nr:hypothetical protein GcM3_024048 [Golovinomyces cichoracearum]
MGSETATASYTQRPQSEMSSTLIGGSDQTWQ